MFFRKLSFFVFLFVIAFSEYSHASERGTRVVPKLSSDVRMSYAPLVNQVAPAVVSIYARRIVDMGQNPLYADPFWADIFGYFNFGMPRQRIQNSLGSGVIVSEDGLIITNYHVIDGADEITLILKDYREFDAEVVLSDERSDLAVLRMHEEATDFHYLEVANSDEVMVGDTVMAIGNPFGVGQSVSVGIISALARTQTVNQGTSYFLQTDAAINPGNSGGALVDITGSLVGINTAIFSRSGGSNGIGFAIPSNLVTKVLQAVAYGQNELRRPWRGFDGQMVTSDIAASIGLKIPIGIILRSVTPESPAEAAGLRVGDVIMSVASYDVNDVPSLDYYLLTHSVKDEVVFMVQRGGRQIKVKMDIVFAEETLPRNITVLRENSPLVGVVIANLSPAFSEEIDFYASTSGVIIFKVPERSYARSAGIRAGEIIISINGRKIQRVQDVVQELSRRTSKWNIELKSGNKIRQVQLP